MIIVDTSGMYALLDADEANHSAIKRLYEKYSRNWILPSAILPEVDYLVSTRLGQKAQDSFLADLIDGLFFVDWASDEDFIRAHRVYTLYRSLRLGFVDTMVVATAERLNAEAIVTLDLRHFAALAIKGNPRLLPRDSD